jgi:adenine phosphoribosyltransferase
MPSSDLKNRIRNVPDFPKKGIQFKDRPTLLAEPASFQQAIDLIAHRHFAKGIEAVVGIEGARLRHGGRPGVQAGDGVLLVRKPGKLPRKTVSASYDLDTERTISRSTDAIRPGMRSWLRRCPGDGGTMSAVLGLLRKLGPIL